VIGGLGTLVLSYAAGALSTLSPCVLPLLPIILFSVLQQSAWGPLALGAGLAASFSAIGVFTASIGFNIGLDGSVLRLVIAVFLVATGIVLLVPAAQARLAMVSGPIVAGGQAMLDRLQPSGLGGQFLLGVALGAIWTPCTGPTLGAAIGLAAQSESLAKAAVIMAVFSLGAVTPILIIAYGSRQAVFARRDRLMNVSRVAKPLIGYTLLIVGLLVLTGLDKRVETVLTDAMPDWLLNITTLL
jgi:cytochrome c-type biogenesis protein